VLPTTYGLIENMGPDVALSLDFVGETKCTLEPKDMHPGVLEARTNMCNDWVSRWITNIDPNVKRTYAIATLLHPCFKTYDFIDGFDLIPQSDKAWALRELRTEWLTVWKPRPKPLDAPAADAPAGDAMADAPTLAAATAGESPAVTQVTKKRKVTLGGLLSGRQEGDATPGGEGAGAGAGRAGAIPR
jgi:hypothetical protein